MNDSTTSESAESESQQLARLGKLRNQVVEEVGKVIVGQRDVVDQILISIFSSGHVLLVGVPGLAKTLLIRTLSGTMNLEFSRIQFTPDLMPSDITGTEVIQQNPSTGQRELNFVRGPVFANMILADEINRTPPKTQAALLEAMQEDQVTVGGTRHQLQQPFIVLATQNPIEQEGTYPLPEALLDRFMMQIVIQYPKELDELEIVRRTTSDTSSDVAAQLDGATIMEMTRIVRRVPVSDHVALFAIRLARLTRLGTEQTDVDYVPSSLEAKFDELKSLVNSYVRWGAGPRASQFLVLAGKARAALAGRQCVSLDDIRAVAAPVMRHRIRTNFQATSENVTGDLIIEQITNFLDLIDKNESGIDSKLFGSANSG